MFFQEEIILFYNTYPSIDPFFHRSIHPSIHLRGKYFIRVWTNNETYTVHTATNKIRARS